MKQVSRQSEDVRGKMERKVLPPGREMSSGSGGNAPPSDRPPIEHVLMKMSTGPVPTNSQPAAPVSSIPPGIFPSAAALTSMPPAVVTMTTTTSAEMRSMERESSSSSFSRDSIVRSLQEMVKPAITAMGEPGGGNVLMKEDTELTEKQRSALEFAISMYMVASEFYDGGSLWCRLCDGIFGDMSSLCRHLHSDQHQLVRSMVLVGLAWHCE